jgi:hypothetical protein
MNSNTYWRPIFWEPVAGTGERLTVGVIVEQDDRWIAHRIIRDDVLDCLFGKAAQGIRKLIDTGMAGVISLADVDPRAEMLPSVLGLSPGPLRHTYAANLSETLRTAALLYSSLANLDKFDELEESDAPTQEESNQRFSTEVRALVLKERPELESYFGRTAPLLQEGQPIKFGFCSPKTIIHFGVLNAIRQSASLRDAHARLWELHRAREFIGLNHAALIMATPREDDATLSGNQMAALRRNLLEIGREADTYKMRFLPVTTAKDGARRVIEYA